MGDFYIRMLEKSIVGRNVEGVKSALDKGASPDGKTGTGKKPIHFAVESESSEIVKMLCERGANLNVQNPEEYGSTALHMAVRKGGITLVKLLLGEGADPNLADETGDTPLVTAITRNEVGIVGLLLEHKADVHTPDKFGSPALHNAVKGKNSDIVSLLLQAGASVQKTDMSDEGVMHAAARFGNDWILSALKEKGCDMDRKLQSDGSSPLHLAAESGNLEAVRWLVENGAQLTETDKNGLTPEERAVRSNKQHVVTWIQEQKRSLQKKRDISQNAARGRKNNFDSNISLGNAGPSPNTAYSGVMSLHEAAQRGDLTRVMTFLQRGTNVNQKDRDGCTPLHYAAKGGHLQIVKKLMERGASLVVIDAKGNRPVHMAASGGHLDVLDYFLSIDKCADAPGEGGNSVVHIAASRGDLDMLHLLKKRKCNMESHIPRKCSPLHLAIEGGHFNVVQYLVHQGVDMTSRNKQGKTPLELAEELGKPCIIEILQKASGKGTKDSRLYPELPQEESESPETKMEDVRMEIEEEPMKTLESELLIASAEGDERGVRRLLRENPLNIEVTDDEGRRPLHLAALKGNLKTVEHLLLRRPDLTATDHKGLSVVHCAVLGENINILQLLQSEGFNLKALTKENCTALHLAASQGLVNITRWLVNEAGLEVSATNKKGETALDLAIRNKKNETASFLMSVCLEKAMKTGDVETIRLLAEEGVNIEDVIRRNFYSGAVHVAASHGHVKVLKLLRQLGCDMNATTGKGDSGLHCAASNGHLEAVKWLVEKADHRPFSINIDGCSALDYAKDGGNEGVITYLRNTNPGPSSPRTQGHVDGANGERSSEPFIKVPASGTAVYNSTHGGHTSLNENVNYGWKASQNTAGTENQRPSYSQVARGGRSSHIKTDPLGVKTFETTTRQQRREQRDLDSEILKVAREGNAQGVRALKEEGANLEVVSSLKDEQGLRPLHLAAWAGHAEVVRALLDCGANREARGPEGHAPVHYAAKGNHVTTLRVLKEKGCRMGVPLDNGNTALHVAAEFGNTDAAKWLVENAGIEVGQKNNRRETALDVARQEGAKGVIEYLDMKGSARIALQKGDVVTMERLLSNGFDVNAKYEDKNFKDYRPLHFAAEEGHISVTCLLLNRNAHVNVQNSEGLTPLHLAAWAGHVEVIKALLSKGANPRLEDAEGRKPIHLASIGGHELALEALAVDGGIHSGIESVTSDSNRKTPLHLAAENGNLKAVRFLVEQKVEINKTDARGRTALQLAIDDFHKPVVEYLQKADPLVKEMRVAMASGDVRAVRDVLDRGINLKNPNLGDQGASILHTAVLKGNRDIFELLLRNGAPKDAVDRDGNTVTHYAAAAKDVVMLETLHNQNSVNLNAKNSEGNTPLHIAANKDSTEAIKWLLGNGARKNVKNNDMQTAERIAVAMKNYIAADIIKNHQSQYDDDAEGLANLGNTCYINTIIQCLFHIEGLRNLFKDGEYKQYMENGVLTNRVSETFADVVESLSTGGVDEMLLKKFKETVCKYDNLFVGNDQHDAHDFFSAFTSSALSEFKAENNRFHILFYGTTCSTIKCKKCRTVALRTLEDFSSLNLSLQKTHSKLFEMASAYYKKQEIDWDCPTCKKLSRCERKVTVERLPEVLVIHFNRFLGNARSTFKAEVTYNTTIKVNELIPREHRGSIENSTYDLRSVCSHVGSMVGGHYTAICQRNGKWNRFSDKIVTPVPERDAITNEALILFYEARR